MQARGGLLSSGNSIFPEPVCHHFFPSNTDVSETSNPSLSVLFPPSRDSEETTHLEGIPFGIFRPQLAAATETGPARDDQNHLHRGVDLLECACLLRPSDEEAEQARLVLLEYFVASLPPLSNAHQTRQTQPTANRRVDHHTLLFVRACVVRGAARPRIFSTHLLRL